MADPQTRYVQLGRLLEAIPHRLFAPGQYSAGEIQWLARGFALVSQGRDETEVDEFKKAMDEAISYEDADYSPMRQITVRGAMAILYRQLAVAEMEAPVSGQGAFIPAGNEFDALAAFAKVAGTAKREFLIVDPYMDEKALTDFAPTVDEGVSIRLLADQQYVKPSLQPAVRRWTAQYGTKRPLSARLTAQKTLHDRLLMVDGVSVWIVTQSLNAIAQRSPASIVRVEGDTATDKLAAYQNIWNAATIL
jgi:hypothetical protein